MFLNVSKYSVKLKITKLNKKIINNNYAVIIIN